MSREGLGFRGVPVRGVYESREGLGFRVLGGVPLRGV